MNDALNHGFYGGLSNASLTGGKVLTARPKDAASALTIRAFHPLIKGAVAAKSVQRAAATAAVNAAQTLTPAGAGATGSITLTFTIGGVSYGPTAAIAYNASVATIQGVIDDLFNRMANPAEQLPKYKARLGVGNIVVSGAGPLFSNAGAAGSVLTLTYRNVLGSRPQTTVTVTMSGGANLGGTGTVTAAAGTVGVLGNISSAALLGFSNEWQNGPLDGVHPGIARAKNNLDGPYDSSANLIHYQALADYPMCVFSARVAPWVAVADSLVTGTAVNIGYWSDLDMCYIDTGSTANGLALVRGFPEDQRGVYGGYVEFSVPATAIQTA